jgi:CxxC motif-containing protein (DUF1111 family)
MGYSSLRFTTSAFAVLLSLLFASPKGFAKELEFEARQDLTGAQLFEHEWKSNDASSQKSADQARRPSGERANAQVPPGDGLGPLHNATSCSQCHLNGGSSGVKHNVTLITVDPRSDALRDKAKGGDYLLEVFPGLLGPTGVLNFTAVVHDRSTRPGYKPIRNRLTDFVPEGIDDRWFHPEMRTSEAIASQPVVTGRHGPVDFYLSQRNSPALFGAGIIDAINEVRIQALAKKQAAKTDGKVSGRFVGKFGWRGQVNSLATFVSQACAAELGLSQAVVRSGGTSRSRPSSPRSALSFTASQAGDPADFRYTTRGIDMTTQEVAKLTSFVASLPRPREQRRSTDSLGNVLDGEKLFGSVGCLVCHVADLRPASGIFSDLLVHDMGARLQSPIPASVSASGIKNVAPVRISAFDAKGPSVNSPQQYYTRRTSGTSVGFPQEWRTPPLWGVADTGPYLHDGRAATLEEAILWHGGEAEPSRKLYSELPRESKDLVLSFLSSLRAPNTAKP